MLVDPRDGVPFYVGKGQGVRHDAHLAEALLPDGDDADDFEQSKKVARIRQIVAENCEPEVWILRYGLSVGEYTAVEAAVIDLLMSFEVVPKKEGTPLRALGVAEQLTNRRREQARGHGLRLLSSLIDEFAAPVLETETPLLLITLNGESYDPDNGSLIRGRKREFAGFKPEWRESAVRVLAFGEIGESICGWWSIDTARIAAAGIKHVVAVHKGVTRALFEIVDDTWEYAELRYGTNGRPIRDVAFDVLTVSSGQLFDEVVGPHGHQLPMKSEQNALRYWPVQPKV